MTLVFHTLRLVWTGVFSTPVGPDRGEQREAGSSAEAARVRPCKWPRTSELPHAESRSAQRRSCPGCLQVR